MRGTFVPGGVCYPALHFSARTQAQGKEIRLAERPAARPSGALLTRYWLPVLVYVSAILVVSAQPDLQVPTQFRNADKFYHVLEYLGLGVLLARACRASLRSRVPLDAAKLTLVLGIIVGVSDEIFQSFIPGRISSPFDVLADATGLLLAQIMDLLRVRR